MTVYAQSYLTLRSSVGRQGQNLRADVKTVQAALNAEPDFNPGFGARLVEALDGARRLIVDGLCGPKTEAAIRAFQEGLSIPKALRGVIAPRSESWYWLSGTYGSCQDIKGAVCTEEVLGVVSTATGQTVDYRRFWQGRYGTVLGEGQKSKKSGKLLTIGSSGCLLVTLTMAATVIGARRKHWPRSLKPRQLTPIKANSILKDAGAFSGANLNAVKASAALGMRAYGYGRKGPLGTADLPRILDHLARGYPIAAHVDYKDRSYTLKNGKRKTVSHAAGDHWVLLTGLTGNIQRPVEAIDPMNGKKMWFQTYPEHNDRYESISDQRHGVLFGFANSKNARTVEKQFNYTVVRYYTLHPDS